MRSTLATFAIAFVVGFVIGFYTKSEFVMADKAKAAITTVKEVSDGIMTSAKVSESIEAENAKTRKQVKAITKTVVDRVTEKENANPDTCTSFAFDLATASLLNSARTGIDPDAASISDDARETPTDLGIQGFVENDGEIVTLYRELAKEHDTLVEYVEGVMKRQSAER